MTKIPKMPRPRACENPKKVALRSASLWLNRIAMAIVLLPELWYWLTGIDYNPYTLMIVWLTASVGVEAARYVRQDSMHSPMVIAPLAVLLAMSQWPSTEPPAPVYSDAGTPYSDEAFLRVAVPLVAKWEGLRTKAYIDVVGVPTVCYGDTQGVEMGDVYTKEECREKLREDILKYRAGWHEYLTKVTLRERLHPGRDASFSSLAYNVGVRTAGTSTATRRLNAGDIAGACEASTWYKKGGGRVLRGLVRRRSDEYAYCMKGLDTA